MKEFDNLLKQAEALLDVFALGSRSQMDTCEALNKLSAAVTAARQVDRIPAYLVISEYEAKAIARKIRRNGVGLKKGSSACMVLNLDVSVNRSVRSSDDQVQVCSTSLWKNL